jgi:hypothetical protein
MERSPERVAIDVRDGYVSAEEARECYGVVLTEGGDVDAAATDAMRSATTSPGYDIDRGEIELGSGSGEIDRHAFHA